jgi:Flp pilus assembly pilin Flp
MNAVLLRTVNLQVHDLSEDGCLLITRVLLPVGTVGVLEMEFDGRRLTEWFRTCRAQRTHGRSGLYLAGVEFLTLTAAGDSSLRTAVRSMKWTRQPMSGSSGSFSGDPGKIAPTPIRIFAAGSPKTRDLLLKTERSDSRAIQMRSGSVVAPSHEVDAPGLGASEVEECMKNTIVRLVRDDQGQDLIEYVLIGSFVSIGALAGATALGTNLNLWYQDVANWVTTAMGNVP